MSQFVEDAPSGTIDGTNTVFNCAVNATTREVYLNGLLQDDGVDFTMSGLTLTFTNPPQIGDGITSWAFRR